MIFKRNLILSCLEKNDLTKYELSNLTGLSHVTIKGYISRLNQEKKIIHRINGKYSLIPELEKEIEY